jgi:hypothetical protein
MPGMKGSGVTEMPFFHLCEDRETQAPAWLGPFQEGALHIAVSSSSLYVRWARLCYSKFKQKFSVAECYKIYFLLKSSMASRGQQGALLHTFPPGHVLMEVLPHHGCPISNPWPSWSPGNTLHWQLSIAA